MPADTLRRRLPAALAALLAAGAATLALATAPPGLAAETPQAAAAAPVKIMPLGDSITGSPGCWRALLWNRLQSAGLTNIDFVGTLPPQGCGVAHDGDNEGHGGILATNMADQGQLVPWLAATNPDIVLMHLGTNDTWSAVPPATLLAAYGTLVDQMRANNPNVKVLVAQIIPLNPPTCTDCGQRVVNLNAAIPAWAAAKSTAASPVIVVDQWTGFTTATDTYDGVHPNDAGNVKIADRWYPALAAALSGTNPTASPTVSPTPTRGPTASPTPTAGPTGSPSPTATSSVCSPHYRIVGQWQGGFQGELIIKNNGSTPSQGWRATITFATGQQITQIWGASGTQSGTVATITNAGWNGTLAPGASASAGFIATWTGTNPVPPVICVFA